ncbi:MAG: hypothetical protein BGO53_14345 [Sphingobacteriales bacterium 39-19]|nr:MAG: hypothetical protein BGO53_14345 [Sphingobacteriales bacterium 39-19]
MWIPLTNCSKQISLHSKLKESDEGFIKIYEIVSIEFDQYKLKLLEKNNVPPTVEVELNLSCNQLREFRFEVEDSMAASLTHT